MLARRGGSMRLVRHAELGITVEERRPPGSELVEHDADRIHVARRPRRRTAHLLWRHVHRRPRRCTRRCHPRLAAIAREAEVDDHRAIAAYEHILRLEI